MELKRRLNLGGLPRAVERFPDVLHGCEEVFERVGEVLAMEEGEQVGVIHGDFWTGKYVTSSRFQKKWN